MLSDWVIVQADIVQLAKTNQHVHRVLAAVIAGAEEVAVVAGGSVDVIGADCVHVQLPHLREIALPDRTPWWCEKIAIWQPV